MRVLQDVTITAQWTISKYTITFDFWNWTVSSVVLDFNTTIEYPEDIVEREGFTFAGWSPEPEMMPAENITVKVKWTITVPTECVEVTFGKANLTEEEMKKVIEGYVPEGKKFNVAGIESDSEETKIIIRFASTGAAKSFVEVVSASSDANKSGIEKVAFVSGGCSLSTSLTLSTLIYILAYLLSF